MHKSYLATNRNKGDCYTTYLISSMIYKVVKLFISNITFVAYTISQNHRLQQSQIQDRILSPIVNYVNLEIYLPILQGP